MGFWKKKKRGVEALPWRRKNEDDSGDGARAHGGSFSPRDSRRLAVASRRERIQPIRRLCWSGPCRLHTDSGSLLPRYHSHPTRANGHHHLLSKVPYRPASKARPPSPFLPQRACGLLSGDALNDTKAQPRGPIRCCGRRGPEREPSLGRARAKLMGEREKMWLADGD